MSRSRACWKRSRGQTFRASEIVNSLLNFSRTPTAELAEVQLNRVIQETLSLLEHQLKKAGVEVRTKLDPGAGPGERQSGQIAAGISESVSECARRHGAARRTSERLGTSRADSENGIVVEVMRYRARHRSRTPEPHLRSVLHHQIGAKKAPGWGFR